jgi:hypothetical protein
MPANVGNARLEDTELLDADTVSMFGAVEALKGRYSGDTSLLILNYRSVELATAAVEPVSAALFPATSGWKPSSDEKAAASLYIEQQSTDATALVRPHGSLVLIRKGKGAAVAEFDSLLVQQLTPASADLE